MDSEHSIKLRGEGDEYRLGTVLSKLSERGCSILVAGEMSLPTIRLVSQRFFGHPEERRERILVRLRQTMSLEEWFPADVALDDPGVRIIDCTDPTRTAAEGESGFDEMRWKSRFDPTEIPALTRREDIETCNEEIENFADGASPLTPSQLRVGVFTLDALDGLDEMIDVVSSVKSTVIGHRGMVHYHLQRPPTSETAETILDNVDAMVTTRNRRPNAPPEQQWTVPGYGESKWVPLRGFE